YTDMMAAMKKVAESNNELTIEERNLFSVAYKNVIGTYRVPWRTISAIELKDQDSEHKQQMVKKYRKKIENEMKDVCQELLTLLDKHLIQKATTAESKIFYLKMKGDYYRYLAEITMGDERQKMAEGSQHAYDDAFDLAKNQLPVTHPIRLGLVLNFSVFYYEILNKPDIALRLAKQTFDDALAELDSIDEHSYRDSQLILQLLRDNITLWTSDEPEIDNTNQPDEDQ
ncbi:unnamed protein product, partial [Rotaria sp. Silwood2]